jgi:Spy/CpxP family protein refolding chaperone
MYARVRRFGRAGAKLALALVLVAFATSAGATRGHAQPPKDGKQPGGSRPVGVTVNEPKALKGYTLVAPLNSTKAHLIDLDGRVVKTWDTGVTPGASTYFLENGNLLRTGSLGSKNKINGAAVGGRVLEIDWDGEVVWDFTYATDKSQPHHDICKMPNGNVLMIVWDKKNTEEAVAAGRRTDAAKTGVLADAIIEVKPTGKTTGEIVWEWRAWDHLVQDFDKTKANYGNVAQKPELIDLNFGSGILANMITKKEDLDKLKDLGYVGGGTQPPPKGPGGPGGFSADWLHTNAIAYNADLDQIVLSIHEFHEIWIIDHSTTKAEAAGHTGGKYGKGGDLIYRWGNPKAYRAGTNADQRLFAQHNAHWIPKGLPGAGNILVFNNGNGRPGGAHSTVDEVVLPVEKDGKYARKPGLPFGPDKPTWSYSAEKKNEFYAMLISGAQRLPNGNTLICSGPDGTVFEVTPEKQVVWKFTNPIRSGSGSGGPGGPGGMFQPPKPGELMPGFIQDQLKLTAEQKKQLEELQKDVDARLEKLLTEEQRKQLKDMATRGPGGGGFGPGPGGMFRAYRFGEDFAGLKGKELQPGKKLEELGGKN